MTSLARFTFLEAQLNRESTKEQRSKYGNEGGFPTGAKHGDLAETPLAVGDAQGERQGVRNKRHLAKLVR